MRILRLYQKPIALFILLTFVQSFFMPATSWALTSGPTAPETSSFEPVDASDMVNLLTGDMAYTIPLIEVPGPEGGYPLALSYHAGLHPDEEASWVGLGWSLNPGAINRSVSGYADDQHGAERRVENYWEGGEKHSGSVGVGLPVSKVVNLNLSLEVSHDTYQGLGGSVGLGVGVNISKALSANAGIRLGTNGAYGYAGLGIGETTASGLRLGANLNVSSNFSGSTNASLGVSVSKGSKTKEGRTSRGSIGSLDISLGSGVLKPSARFKGASMNYHNNKGNAISTQSWGISVPIGIFNIGYRYSRYWLDQADTSLAYGMLYAKDLNVPIHSSPNFIPDPLQKESMDSYAIPDVSTTLEGMASQNYIPEWTATGSSLAPDAYAVSAQGLSGSFKPYMFNSGSIIRSSIVKTNELSGNDQQYYSALNFYNHRNFTLRPQFRFVNDFSNSLLLGNDEFYGSNNAIGGIHSETTNNGLTTGNSPTDADYLLGFDHYIQHLAGSKHIEYFTNEQLTDPATFFQEIMDYQGFRSASGTITRMSEIAIGSSPEIDITSFDKQIGAFKITNESGVTYHFSLPVYAYGEQTYSEEIDPLKGKERSQKTFNIQPYAYNWLLTAITGPDFVDRNNNHLVDSDDWGYWVRFDYGKWTDKYAWRNPYSGFNIDIDGLNQVYSSGKKQLYYLDAISTRTHTALFPKKMRLDGADAGFVAPYIESQEMACYETNQGQAQQNFTLTRTRSVPNVPQLALDKVLLIPNRELESIAGTNSAMEAVKLIKGLGLGDRTHTESWQGCPDPVDYSCSGNCPPAPDIITYYDGNQVLDIDDLQNGFVASNAIGGAELITDYSLCQGTPNSASSFDNSSPPALNVDGRNGKLTLNAIRALAVGGAYTTPPTIFSYESTTKTGQGSIMNSSVNEATDAENTTTDIEIFYTLGDQLDEGEIIRITDPIAGSKIWHGTVVNVTGNLYTIRIIEQAGPTVFYTSQHPNIVYETTKNPPYRKAFQDWWGYFKSDYKDLGYDPISNLTTDVSSKAVDVWSLRKITSPTGAEIEITYESDEYNDVVYDGMSIINIAENGIEKIPNSPNHYKISLLEPYDYNVLLNSISSVSLSVITSRDIINSAAVGPPVCEYSGLRATQMDVFEFNNLSITNIGSNFIEVYDPSLAIEQDIFSWDGEVINGFIPIERGQRKGGGIRVGSVSIHSDAQISETSYHYENDIESTGVTTYEPANMDRLLANPKFFNPNIFITEEDYWQECSDYYKDLIGDYRAKGYQNFPGILSLAHDIPGPGVMYKSVIVKDHVGGETKPGYQVYDFEVPNEQSVELIGNDPAQSGTINNFLLTDIRKDPNNDDGPEIGLTQPYSGIPYYRGHTEIKDKTSRIGNLKRTAVYDDQDRLVSETRNIYLHDAVLDFEQELATNYRNQGVVEQAFFESRLLCGGSGYYYGTSTTFNTNSWHDVHFKETSTKRTEYPNVLSQTITTENGITTTATNKAFDFFTGAVREKQSEDSYGNIYETVSIPAYQLKYDDNGVKVPRYSAMGLKVNYSDNDHMLTQEGATYSYKIDPTTGTRIPMGGAITTWNDTWDYWEYDNTTGWKITSSAQNTTQEKVWRKHQSYTWKSFTQPDGTIDPNTFVEFDWTPSATQAPGWQMVEEITMYDHYSHPMESKDFNGYYATNRMGEEQGAIYASATNAQMREIAFSGMEESVDPFGRLACEVNMNNGVVNTDPAFVHTGEKSMQLAANQTGYTYGGSIGNGVTDYFRSDRTYRASVWVHELQQFILKTKLYAEVDGVRVAATITDPTDPMVAQAGNWSLLTVEVDLTAHPSASTLTFGVEGGQSGSSFPAYLDDFRVHPLTAPITSYVYDPATGQLTAILDAENFASVFHYDAAGRLIKTEREEAYVNAQKRGGLRTVSEHKYNYGNYLRAQFTATPNHVTTNTNIFFEAAPQMAPAGPVSYTWDFGDGTTGSGMNTAHSYSNYGSYTVELEITDPTGCISAVSSEVFVTPPPLKGSISGPIVQTCISPGDPFGTPPVPPTPPAHEVYTITPTGGDGTYNYSWSYRLDSQPTFVTTGGNSPTVSIGGFTEGFTLRCQIDDGHSMIDVDFLVEVYGCGGAAQ